MTTTRKPVADEAQTEPVDKPKNAMQHLDTLRDLVLSRSRDHAESKVAALRQEMMTAIDGLAETVTQLAKDMDANPTPAEDDVSDRLDQIVDGKFSALFGLDALTQDAKPLADRFSDLAGDFAQHQVDVHDRVNKLAKDFGESLRIAQLEASSAVGIRNDVIAERRAGVPAILGALWEVMKEVTYVPKGGTYDGGSSGNYKFRRFDDVAKELGEAFRRHGIFLKSDVVSNDTERFEVEKAYRGGDKYVQNWTDTRIEVMYTFVSLVDGSEQSVSVVGEGRDLSDKSTSKAMTMALKTALTQAFMLPTDAPDPDSERPGDEPERHESSSDQPQGDPVAEPEPPVLTDEEKADKATAALAAARKAASRQHVLQIMKHAAWLSVTGIKVEGMSLGQHLAGIMATLPAATSD